MLLRYLRTYNLYKINKKKQLNGSTIDEYEMLGAYQVQKQDLTTDEVATSIYGADINSIYRISSVLGDLEEFLLPKVSNKDDNISKYLIGNELAMYRIKSVSEDKVDIQRI
jgi:hypothetical protein